MRYRLVILFLVILCSCGRQSIKITEVWDDPLYVFDDFPDSLFLGLYFHQTIDDSRQNLEKNNFSLIDSSGAWRYLNSQDSSEIILPAAENLHSFKLMMKSEATFKSMELMHALFERDAVTVAQNSGFSVYTYVQNNASFKLSIFEQKDLVRLSFEEQMRK